METTMKVYYYGGELYHHGIQGQKWGVRRYQNPDGTLTDEGRKRYGIYGDRMSKEEGFKRGVKAEKLVKIGKGVNIANMALTGLRTMSAGIAAGKLFAAGFPALGAATLAGAAVGVGLRYLATKGVMKLSSNIARTTDVDRQVYKNAENNTFAEEPKSFYKNHVKPVYKEDMKKARKLISAGGALINLGDKDKGIETAGVGYTIRNNAKRYKALGKNEAKGKNDEYYRKEAEKYGFNKNGDGYKIFKEADLGNVYAKHLIKDAKKDDDSLKKLIKRTDEKT